MIRFLLFVSLAMPSLGHENADKSVVQLVSDFMILQKNYHINSCYYSGCSKNGYLEVLKKGSESLKYFSIVLDMKRNISNWSFKHHQLFVLDMSCSSSTDFLNEANKMGALRHQSAWLLVYVLESNSSNLNTFYIDTTKHLGYLNLTVASEVYIVQKENSKTFRLIELYSLEPSKSIIMSELLVWNLSLDLKDKIILSISNRRQNLLGHTFRAAIVLTNKESLNHADDLVRIHVDSLSKVNYVIVSLVGLALNASVDFIVAPSWGSKVNETFDGMIGLVVEGKADIAVTQSFPTEERMEVLDYIDKAVRTRVGFILMSPPLSFNNNIYILPFNIKVWSCFLTMLFVTMVMLYYANKIGNKKQKHFFAERWIKIYKKEKCESRIEYFKKKKSYTWSDVALLCVASVCQQGSHIRDPNGNVGRIVILTLHLSLIFIYVSYSAYIVVLLQSSDKSITTLKDLLQSNLDLGVHDISYNRYYFQAATDQIRRAIYKKIVPEKKPDHFVTIEEGIKKVKSGLYALQVERSPGYQMVKKIFTKDEKCGLQELKESFTPDIEPMLGIRKVLPYSEVLKMTFKRLHEIGIAHRIGTRLYTKKPSCSRNRMSYDSIALINTRHAFMFLLCALTISWIILISEVILYKRKRCGCYKRKK